MALKQIQQPTKQMQQSTKELNKLERIRQQQGYNQILAAFDCETNGGELHHGDLPFMICFTFENKEQITIEWEVNPETRTPLIEIDDLVYVVQLLTDPQYCWIGHNIKFDTRCVEKAIAHVLGQDYDEGSPECQDAAIQVLRSFDPILFLTTAHDTHSMSHAVDNRSSHKLKDLCVRFLDIGEDDVRALEEQVHAARKFGKQQGWAIASPSSRPLSSSQEESNSWWKIDMWLPHAEARYFERNLPEPVTLASGKVTAYPQFTFDNLCQTYCLRDTERTLLLFVLLRDMLIAEKLWDQYMMNQRLLAVTYEQERYGASIHMDTLLSEQHRYLSLAANFEQRAKKACGIPTLNIQSTEQVALIVKNIFNIPIDRTTKAGKETINKDEMETIYSKYEHALALAGSKDKESSRGSYNPQLETVFIIEEKDGIKTPTYYLQSQIELLLEFLFCCMASKKCKKAANQDLHGYKKRALGYINEEGLEEFYLHSGVNIVGTDTTRISAHDPNLTNVSKGKNAFNEDIKELDLSLRKIFGPALGRKWVRFDYKQLQLVIAATVSGEEEVLNVIHSGGDLHEYMHSVLADRLHWNFNKEDDGQRTIAKNTNFGFWFGAGNEKINKTTHTSGIFPILCERFPNAQKQIRKDINEAERIGYVSASGYKLYPPPDKPYSATVYKVQGWEGKIAKRAAYDCWQALRIQDKDVTMILFVHDELVFDMPANEPQSTIDLIHRLMVEAGDKEGIKVEVDVKVITEHW